MGNKLSIKPAVFIEISRSALVQNLKFIRSVLKPNVRFSSVIKGNAYGHGIEVFVPVMEEIGVDHFSVFNGDEAEKVFNIKKPGTEIMVMGMLTQSQLAWCIKNGISFYIFDLYRLKNALQFAQNYNLKAKIHLEIETGMNRTGLNPDELEEVVNIIEQNNSYFEVKGICTHLAGAESIANYYRIKNQMINFKKTMKRLRAKGVESEYQHVASSSATVRYPDTQLDLVRIGIMQYGFFPTREVMVGYFAENKLVDDPLRRALSWKSQVMSTKKVKTGEFIGYGTAFFAGNDMQIATVPIGYGYGFARSLTNQGKVIINGEYAAVVGIVNMNMICVDITQIYNVKVGDQVTIIGRDGDKEISVSSFSDISNQVNYELLTRLPQDIPRFVVD